MARDFRQDQAQIRPQEWPEPSRRQHRTPRRDEYVSPTRRDRQWTRSDPRPQRASFTANRLMLYLFLGVALVLVCAQLMTISDIVQNGKQISMLETSIRVKQGENENMNVRIDMQQNITRVRDEAMYRLGMESPIDGQIRVISLKRPSIDIQQQTAMSGAGSME